MITKKEKGSVLLTVLVMFLIISLVLVLLFTTIITIQVRAMNQIKRLDAKLIAEAGVEECLFILNSRQNIYSSYEREFGNGKYEIEIKLNDDESEFTIESIGHVLNGENISCSYYVIITGQIKNNKYIIKEYQGRPI